MYTEVEGPNAWFVIEVWIWCRIWRSTWKPMHLKVQCLATIVVQCSKLKIVWTVMCQGSIDNTKRPLWCFGCSVHFLILFPTEFCFLLPGSLTSLGDVDCMFTGKSYNCSQCETVVAQKINMKKQIETHLPAILWPCEHCGIFFQSNQQFIKPCVQKS